MLFKKFTNENASEKVTVKERLAYGCGDFSSNIMYSAMAAFLLFYYTDVVGVSAAAVGVIMMCSRLFDGVSDLIMGVIIDRTKSLFGKARIWILRLVIPYAIGTVLLFSVPTGWSQTAKLIYIFFSYNLAFTVLFTGINLPYATLTALMTQDQYERSVLSIFRMILATCGTLFIKTCTLPVVKFFGDDARAWTMTFVVFGFLEIVTFMITFLFTRERVNTTEDENRLKIPVSLGFKALVKNKYWFMATLNLILIFIAQGINGSAEVYYTKIVLGNSSLVGTFSVALQATQIICMFFIAGFVKKFGKRNLTAAGFVLYGLGSAICWMAPTNMVIVLVGQFIKNIGGLPCAYVFMALMADTYDHLEWKNGFRVDGAAMSIYSIITVAVGGICTGVFNILLSKTGYIAPSLVDGVTVAAQQPDAVKSMITFCFVGLEAKCLSDSGEG